jgi:hypothetical protein
MTLSGFIFTFLFSMFGHSQQHCLDLFKVDSNSRQNSNLVSALEAEFEHATIYERLEMLDYVTVQLQQKMQETPKPSLWSWLTSEGAQQRREYSELKQLSLEVKELRAAYRVVNSLLHGSVKRHNLQRDDELQLLNRLITEKDMLGALKFLDARQTDVRGNDRLEQYFIDSVIMYLAWGPSPKKFPVPIKNWLIFDIVLGHKKPKYMIDVASLFRDMAKVYKDSKKGLTPAEAHLEEYSVLTQDRVFALIEKTEKKFPHVIERVIEQELNQGHIVPDDNGELHIVDESL